MNQPRQRDRRPEELDEVVAQLNNLGGLVPSQAAAAGKAGGWAGGRDGVLGGGGGAADIHQRPLIMDDASDDEDVGTAPDGTLLASTPARPL